MARSWKYFQTLSVEDVLSIRRRLTQSNLGKVDFGDEKPVYLDKLTSAVERQNTGFGGREKYERPHQKVATLFYGIAMNHAFENGNKRTALISSLVLLDQNNFDLVNTSEEDLYEMATTVVAHTFPVSKNRTDDTEVEALASWFRKRMKRRKAGNSRIDFRELRRILEGHGCEFDPPHLNYMKIRRGKASVKIGYPRENFTIPPGEVKRIRRNLGLDGMGNRDFYDIENTVDQFVLEYTELLQRLADA